MADPMVKLEVKYLKQVQQAMVNTVNAIDPHGDNAIKAITFATLRLHRYMTSIVHVKTGRLKNSLFPEINADGGRIFTNLNYAPYEEGRGGSHAFMERTSDEDLPQTAEVAMNLFGIGIEEAWNSGG